MKAREWWIGVAMNRVFDMAQPSVWNAYACGPNSDARIHVREVLPGTVTITREDLRAAFSAVNDQWESTWIEDALIDKLFGPRTPSTTAGEK